MFIYHYLYSDWIDGPTSDVLQQAYVPIVKPCPENGILEGMICAGYDAGGKDACQVGELYLMLHFKYLFYPKPKLHLEIVTNKKYFEKYNLMANHLDMCESAHRNFRYLQNNLKPIYKN